MRINRFSYENKATGWKLAPVEFGDFNLLVGVSGVGKTKILEAIEKISEILGGIVPDIGMCWDIAFSINEIDYHWSGVTEYPIKFNPGVPYKLPDIEEETLIGNGFIFKRKLAQVTIDNIPLPVQLNPFQSILVLFQQEERVGIISKELRKISNFALSESMTTQEFEPNKAEETINGFTTLEAIQNSGYSIHTKLIMTFKNLPNVFEQIKEDYIAIFPQVQHVGILQLQTKTVNFDVTNSIPKNFVSFEFYLRENGVDIEIEQEDISTGMLKTLLLIGAIYLSPPGTVILIDEFENSLGVNCIDIFEQIPYQKRGLQFIITSHHPQIISSIPMQHWKIVTRHGSTVTVHDAKEFKRLNASKLDPFVQLINLPEYTEGVTSE